MPLWFFFRPAFFLVSGLLSSGLLSFLVVFCFALFGWGVFLFFFVLVGCLFSVWVLPTVVHKESNRRR